ncbi:hypothetical protein HK101_002692 [Irineochytrium annulatum]|nr:hypothetical protein HK101_002692 [Irineochytrium annulatum]
MIPSVQDSKSQPEVEVGPASDKHGTGTTARERLFTDIDGDIEPTVIESLCMNCEENGTTRLLLTVIPHFKEVILMHFECPHCGFSNNEIQSGSAIQERGITVDCKVESKEDLNRQVVKAESASVKFVELDFEIPAATQRGVLSTIEGLISKSIEGLSALQPQRKLIDESIHDAIQRVIDTLQSYLDRPDANPFTIHLDDPSGNSFIENPHAPRRDPNLHLRHYARTPQQDEELGLTHDPTITDTPAGLTADQQEDADLAELRGEVHVFPGNCSRCNGPSDTRMHILDIPHFKEVVIMATDCESCGYKSNEVKAGGAISAQGRRIKLKMEDTEDLSRDILKSETCGLEIPELELELTSGTLGGRFTTVEGLLRQVHDELAERAPFSSGDSADETRKKAFAAFLGRLRRAIALEIPYTLILDDPLANSYLQNLYAPDPDPNMEIEFYDRTHEQNEDLGLNDMVLEGYEAPTSVEDAKKE